jgi:hypothetical protein
VTAQKQEENVQDVPVNMSVFNEMDLQDKSVENVFDMADQPPQPDALPAGIGLRGSFHARHFVESGDHVRSRGAVRGRRSSPQSQRIRGGIHRHRAHRGSTRPAGDSTKANAEAGA